MVIHGTNNLIKQSSSSKMKEELCQLITFLKKCLGKNIAK
jgi:hypothetical protein